MQLGDPRLGDPRTGFVEPEFEVSLILSDRKRRTHILVLERRGHAIHLGFRLSPYNHPVLVHSGAVCRKRFCVASRVLRKWI